MDIHTTMMRAALAQAALAKKAKEVPVGAVVYNAKGHVISAAHNRVEILKDATAHAEFLAAKAALKVCGQKYLNDYYVAVTLEPCAMCAQALSWLRVKEIRFGAYDIKSGAIENGARVLKNAHWKPLVYGGFLEEECQKILQDFFKERR